MKKFDNPIQFRTENQVLIDKSEIHRYHFDRNIQMVTLMGIEDKIALLKELLLCGNTVYTWKYDADLRILSSNCPQESLLGDAFELFGGKEILLEQARIRISR